MKKIILMTVSIFLVTGSLLPVKAGESVQQIHLNPGSDITIEPFIKSHIYCDNNSTVNVPNCYIKYVVYQGYRTYQVYIDTILNNSFSNHEDALSHVKLLQEAGLCRR